MAQDCGDFRMRMPSKWNLVFTPWKQYLITLIWNTFILFYFLVSQNNSPVDQRAILFLYLLPFGGIHWSTSIIKYEATIRSWPTKTKSVILVLLPIVLARYVLTYTNASGFETVLKWILFILLPISGGFLLGIITGYIEQIMLYSNLMKKHISKRS
jgi:hypothetical protein